MSDDELDDVDPLDPSVIARRKAAKLRADLGDLAELKATPPELMTPEGVEVVIRAVEAKRPSRTHALGEPCDICDGRGFDFIGRPCRRLARG